jgi:hypothetical protein
LEITFVLRASSARQLASARRAFAAFARPTWTSTPLAFSRKRAIGTLVWKRAATCSGFMPCPCSFQQHNAGEQQASAEPVGLFLLLDIACEELEIAHTLDRADIMVEDDVSQLMGFDCYLCVPARATGCRRPHVRRSEA